MRRVAVNDHGIHPADGGLRITMLAEEAPRQHSSLLNTTKPHVKAITQQCSAMPENSSEELELLKSENKKENNEARKHKIERIDGNLDLDTKRLVEQARDKGCMI